MTFNRGITIMRKLSEHEIRQLMDEIVWGTLIAIDDEQPYAIETSFAVDDRFLYTGSKRDGRMNRCIAKNPVVTFKICDSTTDAKLFRAAIVESEATILTERNDILQCLRIIYKKLGLPESRIEERANKIIAKEGSLNLYRIPLKKLAGVASGS
jgi:nitroimidazol reductase NimA-like FMN-containing flavoprotein (pyridoxamine 5'-phosphate oxidase superfamily)